ncbi:unnamed protein product, partial [Mesorhabditis spiculigera]
MNGSQPEAFACSEHHDKVYGQLDRLRRAGQLCDITLKSKDGRKLSAHKVVLAANNEFFHALFTTPIGVRDQDECHLREIEFEPLSLLIDHIYNGQLRINDENVQSLMAAASFLDMPKVVENCAQHLLAGAEAYNILGIRALCSQYSCFRIMPSVENAVCNMFYELRKTPSFLNLDIEEILKILKDDKLYIDTEVDVFHAAIDWIGYKVKERKKELPRLLSAVRMVLIPPADLQSIIGDDPLVKEDPACLDQVQDALKKLRLPQYERGQHAREPVKAPGVIFALGGIKDEGNNWPTVEIFDPHTQDWHFLRDLDIQRSHGFSVAVSKMSFYISGGFNKSKERCATVEVYDFLSNTLKQVAPMPLVLSNHSSAFLDGLLYVLGGTTDGGWTDRLYVYDPENDVWHCGAPLPNNRRHAQLVALGRYLYAIGGGQEAHATDLVDRYSPITNTWEAVAPLNDKRSRCGAAIYGQQIYVCGGVSPGLHALDSVEVYDPEKNTWTVGKKMMTSRANCALAVLGEKLYVIGGYDGVRKISSVDVFDVKANHWVAYDRMRSHEGRVGTATFILPPVSGKCI